MAHNKQTKKILSDQISELSQERPYRILVRHETLQFKNIDQARRESQGNTILKKIKNRIAKIIFKDSDSLFLNNLKNENLIIMSDDLFDAFKVASVLSKNTEKVKIVASITEKDLINDKFVNDILKFESKKGLQSALLNVISEVYKQPLRLILAKANAEKE